MRKPIYKARSLELHFQKHKIATISELKEVLGTSVDMTVYRKLSELSYKSSYSHSGKYYTLDKMVRYDNQGLWSYKSVMFSIYGSLLKTVKAFVNKSEEGYSAYELRDDIHVEVKEPLLKLIQREEIIREKISGVYIYFSTNKKIKKRQELLRKERQWIAAGPRPDIAMDELKAAIIIFFSLLDERQKRLYAGLESLRIGHGGDTKIASMFEMDLHTIAKGRKELLNYDVEIDKVMEKGGGRKQVKKTTRNHKKD